MLITILRPYINAFIVIFIAINAFGKIPVFLVLTEHFSHKQKKIIAWQSLLYAFLATLVVTLFGALLLWILGVNVSDTKLAGGIILLGISLNAIILGSKIYRPTLKKHFPDLGVFPVATPLAASPALFTVALVIFQEFGVLILANALVFNMFFVWLILESSEFIIKLIGEKGTLFFSKISEILLTAIAVWLLRQGIIETFFR